jgi:uncharacterized protein (DUF433 family)
MANPSPTQDIAVAPGIVINPERRRGKPTLAGTRITVEEVLSKLAADWSIEEILNAWPHLTREQVLQAIAYAEQLVRQQTPAGANTDASDDGGSEVHA